MTKKIYFENISFYYIFFAIPDKIRIQQETVEIIKIKNNSSLKSISFTFNHHFLNFWFNNFITGLK